MKKPFLLLALTACVWPAVSWTQDRIYRCGNEYTNNVAQAKERGCKLIEGGNVTILGTTPVVRSAPPKSSSSPASAGTSAASSPANAPKVASNEQRARDADARAILEAELRKTEVRLADLRKEYNDGAPQRTPLEENNPQAYTLRTAELKASIARSEADIEGIKRELARLPK